MTTDFALTCDKLKDAIENATNLQEELDWLKAATALPQESDEIRKLLQKIEKKEAIKAILVSASDNASNEENAEVKQQILASINYLNAELTSLENELESLKDSQAKAMTERAENEKKLRAEYDDTMKRIEVLYAEYHEGVTTFAIEVSDAIKNLKKNELGGGKLPAEAEKENPTSDEPEKAEDATSADAKPDSDGDVKEYKVPDALPGLLSIMRRFEEKACEYDLTRRNIEDVYSPELEVVWRKILPTEVERRAIFDIVQAVHIKHLSQSQTRQLAISLPVELLKLCDTRDGELSAFINAREKGTSDYKEGELNKWRPKFTYYRICTMLEWIYKGNSLDQFFDAYADGIEKGKRWPHFEKQVKKAFARVAIRC